MSHKNRPDELEVLRLAGPLLSQIFGEIKIDDSQEDRPDAAFFHPPKSSPTASPNIKRLGVEITSVDRSDDREYFYNEKMVREHTIERLGEVLAGNPPPPEGPLREKFIPIGHNYLYEGAKKKIDKHAEYMGLGDFEQIVLLITSKFLELRSKDFKYLARWTDHLMGKAHFPFSKVIFVCRHARESALIFDKAKPARGRPARKLDHEQGFTRSESEIFPMGQSNLGATFTGAALFPPGKREKGKKRRR